MQSAAARMQSLIDGLLSLSRVTTSGHDFVPVDLAAIAAEVVSDLEVQIERVGGRVEVGHLPTIQADPLQMRQLLQNLIGNGLKFHRVDEPPVVKVSGRFVHGRGERPTRADEEQCRIVVEDNGIGFEEKHGERIFGVFQRLHPRDVYRGHGHRLGPVPQDRRAPRRPDHRPERARPRQHVRDRVAGGADAIEEERGGLTARHDMPQRETPYRILMADDDAEDCLLVRDALGESGLAHDLRFRPRRRGVVRLPAAAGRIRRRPRGPPAGPDPAGPEDARERTAARPSRSLRARLSLRRIPVVALTTSTAGDDVRASYDLGVNSYITKPATFRDLVDILKVLSDYWFEVVELPSECEP